MTQKQHHSEPCEGAIADRDRRKRAPRVSALPPVTAQWTSGSRAEGGYGMVQRGGWKGEGEHATENPEANRKDLGEAATEAPKRAGSRFSRRSTLLYRERNRHFWSTRYQAKKEKAPEEEDAIETKVVEVRRISG
ncbi:hypothetical protein HOY82DRAFT_648669 [Tuber indicum]|nr:hypothetical protein HOY82DRAFT_648669 [Tuber indicum]